MGKQRNDNNIVRLNKWLMKKGEDNPLTYPGKINKWLMGLGEYRIKIQKDRSEGVFMGVMLAALTYVNLAVSYSARLRRDNLTALVLFIVSIILIYYIILIYRRSIKWSKQ